VVSDSERGIDFDTVVHPHHSLFDDVDTEFVENCAPHDCRISMHQDGGREFLPRFRLFDFNHGTQATLQEPVEINVRSKSTDKEKSLQISAFWTR